MTPVELVLSKLPDARRCGAGWSARCPAHDDRRASLSVSDGDDGRALVKCHAGCTFDAIVSALGLMPRDLMPANTASIATRGGNGSTPPETFPTDRDAVAALTRKHGQPTATWTYEDGHGEPVGHVLRWDQSGGGKTFRPVSRHGTSWRIGGMPTPRPLYRLPDLSEAQRVYVTEGEKAADALCSVGLVATTSPHGSKSANKADWIPLAGREVVIMPDNDGAGRRYADDVARLLAKLKPPPTVKVLHLPGLPAGGDAVEYLAARRTEGLDDDAIRAALDGLADAAEPACLPDTTATAVPVLVRVADVQPEPVRWLWPGRIALGKLTLIAGDPGLGKSLVTLDMAARVSRGTPWPDAQDTPNTAGGVVLLSAEDGLADTIRPRLDAAGADVSRIVALQAVTHRDDNTNAKLPVPFCLATDLPALELAIDRVGDCRLVVIDPITAYLGHTDSHKNADIRAVLAPLADLASRNRVAVVAVTHLRKADGPAMYRAMGSLAFTAAARAVLAVTKDRDDARRRLVLPVKSNLAAEVAGLAYTIEAAGDAGSPVVLWDAEPVTVSADDALGIDHGERRDSSALDEAVDWLHALLADGPVKAKEAKQRAEDDGIKPRTLDRAKTKLRVVAGPDEWRGPWVWRLPEDVTEPNSAPTSPECATPETVAHCADSGVLCGPAPTVAPGDSSGDRKADWADST